MSNPKDNKVIRDSGIGGDRTLRAGTSAAAAAAADGKSLTEHPSKKGGVSGDHDDEEVTPAKRPPVQVIITQPRDEKDPAAQHETGKVSTKKKGPTSSREDEGAALQQTGTEGAKGHTSSSKDEGASPQRVGMKGTNTASEDSFASA